MSSLNDSKLRKYYRITPQSYAVVPKKTNYLWCVLHYGPNNQIKDFVKCAIFASMNNFTMILPPLFPHYADNIRGIQWFEHFYDSVRFKKAIQTVTFDDFLEQNMKEHNKLKIECYVEHINAVKDRQWYSKNALNSVGSHFNKKVEFKSRINLSNQFDLEELSQKMKPCSSVFLHIHYTKSFEIFKTSNIYFKIIFANLYRHPLIRTMATKIISSLPALLENVTQSKPTLDLVVTHFRLGDYTVLSVEKYVAQLNHLLRKTTKYNHLHIMCPYLNGSAIEYLKKHIRVPFTTTSQLYKQLHYTFNDFFFDVLEQEIAYQASLFIGSPWTSYSGTVIMQRIFQNKGPVYIFASKPNATPYLVTQDNIKYF